LQAKSAFAHQVSILQSSSSRSDESVTASYDPLLSLFNEAGDLLLSAYHSLKSQETSTSSKNSSKELQDRGSDLIDVTNILQIPTIPAEKRALYHPDWLATVEMGRDHAKLVTQKTATDPERLYHAKIAGFLYKRISVLNQYVESIECQKSYLFQRQQELIQQEKMIKGARQMIEQQKQQLARQQQQLTQQQQELTQQQQQLTQQQQQLARQQQQLARQQQELVYQEREIVQQDQQLLRQKREVAQLSLDFANTPSGFPVVSFLQAIASLFQEASASFLQLSQFPFEELHSAEVQLLTKTATETKDRATLLLSQTKNLSSL